MTFYLQPGLKQFFSSSQPLFDQIMALRGECFRQQKGRLTQQISLGEQTYFIKQHYGVGWREIFKNLLQGRLPVLSAKNEWQAIQKLQSLGVATPQVVGFGQRGLNPARRQSFVLMEALTGTVSLEELTKHWREVPPLFSLKFNLINKVANITKTLHQNGINHRDFYICHFLLPKHNPIKRHLYLIDLHRAGIRDLIPTRWVIKDLAGLYFSTKEIGLSSRDLYRFMKVYRNHPLREILKVEKDFWQKVKDRGEQLYRDH